MKHYIHYTLILAACCMFCHTMADAQQTAFVSTQHDSTIQQTASGSMHHNSAEQQTADGIRQQAPRLHGAADNIHQHTTRQHNTADSRQQRLTNGTDFQTPEPAAGTQQQTSGTAKVWTLRDCMEYAVSNSTQIRIQHADMDDERIARRDAILNAFTPYIDAATGISSSFGRAVDPETNTYISTTSFNNAYSVSAGITLFNGFQAVNRLRITKTAVEMGISEEQRIKDNICLSTMQAYCNVVYYSRLAGILAEQVETARTSLHVAERQEELGQKGYADVVQMEAELAEMEYRHISAENSRNDALLTLKDVMFWPIGEELEIDLSIADGGAFLPDGTRDTESILANAMASLPDVFIARGAMENARLELRTARWQLAPSLSLNGGWSTSYYTYPGRSGHETEPFRTQFTNNGGEYVQLTLSIPIFDRLSRHSNIANKRNAYIRSTAEYEQKLREVEAEVMRAVQDRDGASAAYMQAERMAEVQQEAYRLNMRKLEQGLISPIEFRTATESYLTAAAERLNTLLQYNIKKAVVAYYDGIPYLEQQL